MQKTDKKYERFYKYDVQRNYQYETHDENGKKTSDITESEWRERVRDDVYKLVQDGICKEVFAIFHDKDIIEDGTLKSLHFHCVATLVNNKTRTAAAKTFLASSAQNCDPCKSYVDSCRYLIHVSESALNARKTIYSVDEVFGWRIDSDGALVAVTVEDFKDAMSRSETKKTRVEQNAVKSALLGKVSRGELMPLDVKPYYVFDTCKVGLTYRDYATDKPLYSRAFDDWFDDINRFYEFNRCSLTSIYIFGGGGVGKSELSMALANEFKDCHGIHLVASPGRQTTFDFAGKYKGERVSLFNEFSACFNVEQFLSIFDPIHACPVNSRNFDKFYFANYAILNTSLPLENFIYNLWVPYAKDVSKIPVKVRRNLLNSELTEEEWLRTYLRYIPQTDDKILQIRRRLPIYIVIADKKATIYVLNQKLNVSYCYAFSEPPRGKEFYMKYAAVDYDINDRKDIARQTSNAVKIISQAIDFYYKINGFAHPSTYPEPFFFKNEEEENILEAR